MNANDVVNIVVTNINKNNGSEEQWDYNYDLHSDQINTYENYCFFDESSSFDAIYLVGQKVLALHSDLLSNETSLIFGNVECIYSNHNDTFLKVNNKYININTVLEVYD